MTDNPILDKNLACISKYNPKLAEDLLKITTFAANFTLVETDLNETNLTYNGVELHSRLGAENEAKEIFEKVNNTPSSIHIVFGIGLGYLFNEFAENSKGPVILYEPNLEILRATLDMVDLSKELSQSNVRVVSDIDSFKSAFMSMYSYKAEPSFTFLDSYRKLFNDLLKELYNQIELMSGIGQSMYNTLKKDLTNSIIMMIDNFNDTLEETPLMEFKDVYKGKTALVVSAGPSLDLNIETIKNNRDKLVIFCVGTAAKALFKAGIEPDFLNVIEMHDCSGQIKGLDLSAVNCILEPYTHFAFHQAKTKTKLVFPSNSTHANICWANYTGIDISYYNVSGTVSYEALASAKMLGFSKIILIGQDLAFVNNQCYSKDSAYSNLVYKINPETKKLEFNVEDFDKYVDSMLPVNPLCERSAFEARAREKLQNLNDTLYFVKGISGDVIPSQADYATFIEHFREFAVINKDLDLINSSMIGADIPGFKNIPLEEALTNIDIIENRVDFTSKHFEYDKNEILSKFAEERAILCKVWTEMQVAKDYVFNYDREFARRRIFNAETNKYLKKMLELYQNIASTYYVSSPIFKALAFNEEIELKYLLSNHEKHTTADIQNVYEQLKKYFYLIADYIGWFVARMDLQVEKINESINSKS